MGLSIEEQREKIRRKRREEQAAIRAERSTKGKDKFHKTNMFCTRGVYYLYKDGKVVYVGMSLANCAQRIANHYNDGKDFDSFRIFPKRETSDKQLFSIEAKYIRKYKPIYNKKSKK